jgi:hypothetical protein
MKNLATNMFNQIELSTGEILTEHSTEGFAKQVIAFPGKMFKFALPICSKNCHIKYAVTCQKVFDAFEIIFGLLGECGGTIKSIDLIGYDESVETEFGQEQTREIIEKAVDGFDEFFDEHCSIESSEFATWFVQEGGLSSEENVEDRNVKTLEREYAEEQVIRGLYDCIDEDKGWDSKKFETEIYPKMKEIGCTKHEADRWIYEIYDLSNECSLEEVRKLIAQDASYNRLVKMGMSNEDAEDVVYVENEFVDYGEISEQERVHAAYNGRNHQIDED